MCSCERMQVFSTVFHMLLFFFLLFFLFLFDRSGSRYLGWKKLDFILESWNHRNENQSEAERREKTNSEKQSQSGILQAMSGFIPAVCAQKRIGQWYLIDCECVVCLLDPFHFSVLHHFLPSSTMFSHRRSFGGHWLLERRCFFCCGENR